MRILSLFSGIGGLELGLERAGVGAVVHQVECDSYAQRVLNKHWPGVGRDMYIQDFHPGHGFAEVVCGGFPCQDVSSAGKRSGLDGRRSGLWSHFRRVVANVEPKAVVVENVSSGAKSWLPHVRRDLHMLGYRTRAIKISAFDVGAPHRRSRVFVLAAHPDRVKLRDESRCSGRSDWPGKDVARQHGSQWTAADADGEGELQQAGALGAQFRWSRDSSGSWSIEPPFCGVAHGVPSRMDRLRCLGNAVVPQCAEVVGHVLMEWMYD